MEEKNMLDPEILALVNGGSADVRQLLIIASSALGPVAKKWYAEGGLELVKEKLIEKGFVDLAGYFP